MGKLIYFSYTRPDIGFSVGVVSQFINNPREEPLETVYCIRKYLKDDLEEDFCSNSQITGILACILMPTGPDLLLTEDQRVDTAPMFGEI